MGLPVGKGLITTRSVSEGFCGFLRPSLTLPVVIARFHPLFVLVFPDYYTPQC